ncbi:hypothetical protein Slin15195_G061480 [Septoria linicola]|uniref:Uncharacterized protein n=1 Tax=Septoria linicola TaxID=215465 RepID=A0A9Q9EK32_9PEZI|nr:hypothetical protein Slin14017_G077280 [Septoria linicola]USW52829.1 hypothetical protein Slin15195_G061480 [Septoria linicola]
MATMDKIFSAYQQRQATLEASQSSNPFAKGIAYISHTLVPLHSAQIPLMDQGFLKGDLTYDVASVWDGRFFRLDDHLDRLDASCQKMRYRIPISREETKNITLTMLAKSGIRDAYVCYIVTRGLERISNTSLGKKAEELTNTLYIWISPYVWVMPPAMQKVGGSAVIARNVRRTPPGAFDPTVKNLQWGDFTRGLMEAGDRGAVYPFLTDGDGNLTEGAGYNVCVIRDGVLYTPDRGVLEGVTRKSVLEVARKNGIETRVEVVPVEVVYQAEEIFMCTTAGGVMPITELDGKPVGSGKVGELTKKIWDGYWEAHWDEKLSLAVDYAVNVDRILDASQLKSRL